MPPMMRIACVLALATLSCNGGSDPEPSIYEVDGPHPVGNARFVANDAARGRTLLTEVWYPADESERAAAETGSPIEEFVPAGAERDAFLALLADAPDPATRRRTRSKLDAVPAAAPATLPVVVFSHCHECTRFSSFTIAERLASWGFVVIAPDHEDNTLLDPVATIDDAFLQTRGTDVSFVLTTALAGAVLPGRLDPARVGMLGHSFGAATVGRVLQEDARVKAGFAMGAPLVSVFPSVAIENIDEPAALYVLAEDNSIGSTGNSLMNGNFVNAAFPVWKIELADAGHWSVSDLCGIVPEFDAGCLEPAVRHDGEPFTWLDIETARNVTAAYATAFFSLHLDGDEAARAELEKDLGATVESRNAD